MCRREALEKYVLLVFQQMLKDIIVVILGKLNDLFQVGVVWVLLKEVI
jgi:hypothetical protein